ncbi:MAG: methionine biosynthesis protein MetW [Alphaproteobacteria bacterium GM7ARS4]|nr:methionine biosynthesis protein MetW [Alphaproteobacteria bacterium GM7ARS4]
MRRLSAYPTQPLRTDLKIIASLIPQGCRVLDIGCGDGTLLSYLEEHHHVHGHGIELNGDNVALCLEKGLHVCQGDADTDLAMYPARLFDYAILGHTLQATHNPLHIVKELVRVARFGVISFPNFGYWRLRLSLLVTGRMPQTDALPHPWHDTPNIHLCTGKDFTDLCRQNKIRITHTHTNHNLMSQFTVCMIERTTSSPAQTPHPDDETHAPPVMRASTNDKARSPKSL